MNNKTHILKRNGAEMQKSLMISLSSIMIFASANADDVRAINHFGVTVTQECLDQGIFKDCPLDQLHKISANNPLIFLPARQFTKEGRYYEGQYSIGAVHQLEEGKTYILDLSHMDKTTLNDLQFRGNMLVSGTLLNDNRTIQVSNIVYNPMPRISYKGF